MSCVPGWDIDGAVSLCAVSEGEGGGMWLLCFVVLSPFVSRQLVDHYFAVSAFADKVPSSGVKLTKDCLLSTSLVAIDFS